MDFSTFAMLVAGIALFLFGMMFFEETIHLAFANSIKDTIKRYADSLVKSISIGAISTSILQSSTVVSMLMLGFVGAGILSLQQGIGIIVGANIGTTLTPWMIALLGFKINIEAMTLPIIALGGILLIAGSRYPKLIIIAKFLFGFGLLFLGLGYMKESVDSLSNLFSFGNDSINLRQSIGLGLLITMVLQTSTGTSVMTLAALSSGMITFDIALGMMIGANVGTAITTFAVSFLSNTGRQHTKKIVALSHVLFNVLTTVIVLILFIPIHRFFDQIGLSDDPVLGIAVFHTLFNVIGVIALGGLIPYYVRYVQSHHLTDDSDDTLFAIDQVSTTMSEEYIAAMKKDIIGLGQEVVLLIQSMTQHKDPNILINDTYTHLKDDCEEWMSKVLRYDTLNVTTLQQTLIESYQLTVIEYLNAIKQLKDIALHYYYLRETNSPAIHKYMDQFDEKLMHLTEIVSFVLDHGRKGSEEKIAQGEKILLLDDTRFLKDIRTSIAHNHDDTENHHYRSQLLKTNRSVILVTRSLLDALISYSRV